MKHDDAPDVRAPRGWRLVAPFVAVLLFAGLAACVHPTQPWLKYAVDDAAAQKKPLVVEFYATWCKPCRHFETHILTDPRVQKALEGFVFVRYDIDRPTGRDAMRRCRANGVPTVVGIDRHGVVRLFKSGTEKGADEFLDFLAQAKAVLAEPSAAH
jgi:thiol:disulfide interchange protein